MDRTARTCAARSFRRSKLGAEHWRRSAAALFLAVLFGVIWSRFAGSAAAADYPDHPIQLIFHMHPAA